MEEQVIAENSTIEGLSKIINEWLRHNEYDPDKMEIILQLSHDGHKAIVRSKS